MTAQAIAPVPVQVPVQARIDSTPLPLRSSTVLGVCEAIGEDFGFNANWLRIPLASFVLFSPALVLAVYAALGLAVLASRMLAPNPKADAVANAVAVEGSDNPANSERELQIAA